MYITLFDMLAERISALARLPRWGSIRPSTRAVIIGVAVILITLCLGTVANFTSLVFTPLVLLGVFYGAVIAKLLGQFLAPKLQTMTTGFIAGISSGSLGAKESKLIDAIHSTSEFITSLSVSIRPPEARNPNFGPAVSLCIWIAICTIVVILGSNSYYANIESSRIGQLAQPVPAPALARALPVQPERP